MDSVKARLEDFYAYRPSNQYIFIPTGDLWNAEAVNKSVTGCNGKPTEILDKGRAVVRMAWAPGQPEVITNERFSQGHPTFNKYQPPKGGKGNPDEVDPWIDLVLRLFNLETDHVIDWLAHRVQFPGDKINHALVLGGGQGIGKDTILEPVKHAVGPWNFAEVSPTQILGRFNGFVKSVVLRVSEARDLGDQSRYGFYEHMKTFTVSPPDSICCDEKHVRAYDVLNCTGVIITTNHKSDGIYLPPDDRRHFVAWSALTKEDFQPDYFRRIYDWYASGGRDNVAAYLRCRDLSGFDPKAPPTKTDAWHEIVNAGRAPEDAELSDVFDALNWPVAVTLGMLVGAANGMGRNDTAEFLSDKKSRRLIPYRLESAGYVPVRNRDDKRDGQWRIQGKRQTAYARRDLPERDRIEAVRGMTV